MHLVDSHYCTDPGKFISVLCTSLSTMLHVELPHVNVLSKMDLIEQYGKLGKSLGERHTWNWAVTGTNEVFRGVSLGGGWGAGVNLTGFFNLQVAFRTSWCFPAAFNLDYYTEVLDLSYLVDHLASDPFFRNYRRLNEKLVEVIEDYSLVSFVPLNVQVRRQERGRENREHWVFGQQFGSSQVVSA